MLDPEYLQHCTDELEKLFADLETSILEDAARRIAENKYANTSTAEHQLNRAKALGLQYDAMTHKMSEILDISESRVQEIITEASYGSISKDNVIFKEAYEKGIIHKFNYDEAGMKKIIIAGIKRTNGEIRNICKTTAKTAKKMLASALDMTYLSVQSGAFSQQDAIKTAVNDIAGKGITWINYESGAHRRIDTTVRTAIRSGVNQTACRCQDKNFDDMGGNLVEVTSHMGARPDHAEWQGKIYWRKKQYKNYRNFEIATKYGTGAGLGGWNCRHSFFPYFEGLSSKTFEHYRLEENEDRYKLDQEQRYNERKIREWKRRQAVHKAGGIDNTKEARKVREWQKRQETFLKAHPEMKRNYAREMIEKRTITFKDVKGVKDNKLLKGYGNALKKGDISSFITFDIYKAQAYEIEEKIVGIKAKNGIMIKGYKTHFVDRQIGQYESSNEPVKGLRQGVPIDKIRECLLSPKEVRKKSEIDWNYVDEYCKITVNPKTGMLIQANPYKRKKVKK